MIKIKQHFKCYVKYEELNKHKKRIKLDMDTGMEVLFAIFWTSQTLELSMIKQRRENIVIQHEGLERT
jgi:hypothetical protein